MDHEVLEDKNYVLLVFTFLMLVPATLSINVCRMKEGITLHFLYRIN